MTSAPEAGYPFADTQDFHDARRGFIEDSHAQRALTVTHQRTRKDI